MCALLMTGLLNLVKDLVGDYPKYSGVHQPNSVFSAYRVMEIRSIVPTGFSMEQVRLDEVIVLYFLNPLSVGIIPISLFWVLSDVVVQARHHFQCQDLCDSFRSTRMVRFGQKI